MICGALFQTQEDKATSLSSNTAPGLLAFQITLAWIPVASLLKENSGTFTLSRIIHIA